MNKIYTVYTDGACSPNPGIMSIGIIIKKKEKNIFQFSKQLGYGTNNLAEFYALLYAVNFFLDNNFTNSTIEFKMDSNLVYNKVFGEWKGKNIKIKELSDNIKSLIKRLESNNTIKAQWIPREENIEADNMSTLNYNSMTLMS